MEGIARMKPMKADDPIASKANDCVSDYIALNNRTLDLVNDAGLIRLVAVLNPRYRFMSRTYQSGVNLSRRVARAEDTIRSVMD